MPCSAATRIRSAVLPALLLAAFAALCGVHAGAQVTRFQVLKADDVIGHVIASRQVLPNGELFSMVSHCEVSVLWKQVIRTAQRTEYANGQLAACHTSLRVNDALRDSSSMVHGTDACFVHPDAPFDCERNTQWTTSRLYFQEPVGQSVVFVESVLGDRPLVLTAPHTYTLTFPNGHTNTYVYSNGVLQEIQVRRPLMDLVFRRV